MSREAGLFRGTRPTEILDRTGSPKLLLSPTTPRTPSFGITLKNAILPSYAARHARQPPSLPVMLAPHARNFHGLETECSDLRYYQKQRVQRIAGLKRATASLPQPIIVSDPDMKRRSIFRTRLRNLWVNGDHAVGNGKASMDGVSRGGNGISYDLVSILKHRNSLSSHSHSNQGRRFRSR